MATLGMTSNSLWSQIVKNGLRPCPAARPARDSLTTSDRPRYSDNVPSVMMITGMRRPTARTPLKRPSSPPKATPKTAARKGSSPRP